MKTKLVSAIFISAMLASGSLIASDYDNDVEKWSGCYRGGRKPARVIDHKDVPVLNLNEKTLSAEMVKKVIILSAGEMNWMASTMPNGNVLAKLNVRNKHDIAVEITPGATKFSVVYKYSNNMNYAVCEGVPFIHPNYNVWVNRLINRIQSKLSAL